MSVKFLGGIFIQVTNLERSIPFYSDVLGLRLRGIEQWDPGRGATFFLNAEHDGWPLLTLIEEDQVQILKHPPFNLSSTNVAEMHHSLIARGMQVTDLEEWDSPYNHHVMFDIYDPDGHPINIIEMTPIKAGV